MPIKAGVTKIALHTTFKLMGAIFAHGNLNYLHGHFKTFKRFSIKAESGLKAWISTHSMIII